MPSLSDVYFLSIPLPSTLASYKDLKSAALKAGLTVAASSALYDSSLPCHVALLLFETMESAQKAGPLFDCPYVTPSSTNRPFASLQAEVRSTFIWLSFRQVVQLGFTRANRWIFPSASPEHERMLWDWIYEPRRLEFCLSLPFPSDPHVLQAPKTTSTGNTTPSNNSFPSLLHQQSKSQIAEPTAPSLANPSSTPCDVTLQPRTNPTHDREQETNSTYPSSAKPAASSSSSSSLPPPPPGPALLLPLQRRVSHQRQPPIKRPPNQLDLRSDPASSSFSKGHGGQNEQESESMEVDAVEEGQVESVDPMTGIETSMEVNDGIAGRTQVEGRRHGKADGEGSERPTGEGEGRQEMQPESEQATSSSSFSVQAEPAPESPGPFTPPTSSSNSQHPLDPDTAHAPGVPSLHASAASSGLALPPAAPPAGPSAEQAHPQAVQSGATDEQEEREMDGGGMYGVVDLGKEKAVEEEEEAGKGGEEDDKDRGEGDSLTITKPSHSLVPSSSSPFVRLPSSKPDRHTDRQALNVQSFASPHRGIAESVDSASAFSSSSSSAQRTSPSSRSTFRPRSKTTPRSRHARVEASLSELDDRKEGGRQEGLAARADSLESSEIKGIEQPEDEQAGFSEEDTPKVDLKGKGRAKRAASNSPERPPVNSSDAIAFPHSPPPSFSVENGSQPRRSNDFLAQNTSRPPSSSQSDDQTPSRSSRRRPPPITSELTPLPSELTPPPSPKSPYHAVRPSHNATTQVPNLQTSSRTRLSSNFPKSSTSSDVKPKQTTLSHSSGSQSTATPYRLDPIINKKTGSYVVLDEAKEVLFEATTKRAEGGKAGGGKKMIVDPDGGGLIYAVIIRDSNWIEQSEDKVEIRLRSECLRVERVLTAVYGEQKLAFVPFYIVGSARVGPSETTHVPRWEQEAVLINHARHLPQVVFIGWNAARSEFNYLEALFNSVELDDGTRSRPFQAKTKLHYLILEKTDGKKKTIAHYATNVVAVRELLPQARKLAEHHQILGSAHGWIRQGFVDASGSFAEIEDVQSLFDRAIVELRKKLPELGSKRIETDGSADQLVAAFMLVSLILQYDSRVQQSEARLQLGDEANRSLVVISDPKPRVRHPRTVVPYRVEKQKTTPFLPPLSLSTFSSNRPFGHHLDITRTEVDLTIAVDKPKNSSAEPARFFDSTSSYSTHAHKPPPKVVASIQTNAVASSSKHPASPSSSEEPVVATTKKRKASTEAPKSSKRRWQPVPDGLCCHLCSRSIIQTNYPFDGVDKRTCSTCCSQLKSARACTTCITKGCFDKVRCTLTHDNAKAWRIGRIFSSGKSGKGTARLCYNCMQTTFWNLPTDAARDAAHKALLDVEATHTAFRKNEEPGLLSC